MGPMEVCEYITKKFAVLEASYTHDENNRYVFHIQVDSTVQFSSFYEYGKEDSLEAIDDITSVLIRIRSEPQAESEPEKEKTLDEEFPVQPNGYRFL